MPRSELVPLSKSDAKPLMLTIHIWKDKCIYWHLRSLWLPRNNIKRFSLAWLFLALSSYMDTVPNQSQMLNSSLNQTFTMFFTLSLFIGPKAIKHPIPQRAPMMFLNWPPRVWTTNKEELFSQRGDSECDLIKFYNEFQSFPMPWASNLLVLIDTMQIIKLEQEVFVFIFVFISNLAA